QKNRQLFQAADSTFYGVPYPELALFNLFVVLLLFYCLKDSDYLLSGKIKPDKNKKYPFVLCQFVSADLSLHRN
uniref:hypothetical protein n=1 Tax=uncultured Duncaniella sp. TaxID=2768039 RepID=UPI0025AF507E